MSAPAPPSPAARRSGRSPAPRARPARRTAALSVAAMFSLGGLMYWNDQSTTTTQTAAASSTQVGGRDRSGDRSSSRESDDDSTSSTTATTSGTSTNVGLLEQLVRDVGHDEPRAPPTSHTTTSGS